MKKRVFFILLPTIILFSCAESEVFKEIQTEKVAETEKNSTRISVEDALKNANSLMNIISSKTRNSTDRKVVSIEAISSSPKTTRSNAQENNTDTLMYIINYDEGFALAAADNRLTDNIYAISDQGKFNLSDTTSNPGMTVMWGMISNHINKNIENNIPNSRTNPDPIIPYNRGNKTYQYITLSSNPSSAIDCMWHQDYPFNFYCVDRTFRNIPTGCGAIAISQFMYHYKHPQSFLANQRSGYYGPAGFISLNWRMIRNMKTGEDLLSYAMETSEGSDAATYLSILIYEIGSQLGAYYHLNITTAQPDKVVSTIERFNYEVHTVDGIKGWRSLNNNHILFGLEHGPILTIGYPASYYQTGHIWLIDSLIVVVYTTNNNGLTTFGQDTFVRCKWGWEDGLCNGYYKSGIFNATDDPYFTDDPSLILVDDYSYRVIILPHITKKNEDLGYNTVPSFIAP